MAQLSKFAKTVHYICHKADPEKLGAIRLNKILWYADTIMYRDTGEPITGEKYVKKRHGPVPDDISKALKDLGKEGKIRVDGADVPGKMKKYVSLSEADTAPFSKEEIELLDDLLEVICNNHTAASISEMSHDIIWDAAKPDEEIPMFAVLAARPGVVTKEDQKWADKIISERSA